VTRHYLFLQGVASPFFAALADHLHGRGERVSRVNFCGGDVLHWGRRPAWRFRGGVAQLPNYLRTLFAAQGFTDLVLFGSRRPVHQPAVELARQAGVRVHVFEEGYVRPNWLTLERDGVNADSPLPRDPGWYLAVDPTLPRYANGAAAPGNIRVRAAHDLAYHLANGLNPVAFAGYRTHRPYTAPVEYAGWIRRFSTLPLWRRRDEGQIRDLLATGSGFFLLPLQLNGDTQITLNSRYGGMPHLIDTVLRSFADDAPRDSRLVIKNHPLDTGLVNYRALISRLVAELDIAGRVLYLESGHLPTLIKAARGVVTVNSTVGTIALAHGRPTIALGIAIYDLPGLTFQGHLRDFWQHCSPPDQRLFHAFRNTVIHTTQVNGDFYTAQGIRMAVRNCDRLLSEESPLQALLRRIPVDNPLPRRAEVS
jgi:capsular polysaccharide export protein